jgi:predicted dehydrogenase
MVFIKKITMAILGFGQRGKLFANIAKGYKSEVELVSVCEKNKEKEADIINNYGISKEMLFFSEKEFFKRGKLADILIISTMDQDHYKQAMTALDLGYHILLEKPIACEKEHIYKIKEKANKLNLKIAVAHVLRYTAFFQTIKEVASKELGKIITMNLTENVGYLHYAHSYVRGNWGNSLKSSPMILAKSCHDIDILRFIKGLRISNISSFGSLIHFTKENKPPLAAKNCINCEVDCVYNAVDFYTKNPEWFSYISTKTDIVKTLKDENFSYGKCVYQSDNDVVDNQVLLLQFEDKTTATFTMTAFSQTTNRHIVIKGTKGEIEGILESNLVNVRLFGKEPYQIDMRNITDDLSHHSGGDRQLFIEFIRAVRDDLPFLTDINYSVESHYLALEAEESRLNNGKLINMEKYWSHYEK